MRLRSGKIINEPSAYKPISIPKPTPKHIMNISTNQQTQQPLSNIDAAYILLDINKENSNNIDTKPSRRPLRSVYGEVTNYIYSMYKNKQ